jgi:divalent metal cation (Fe/Co/Zn/Cd) transporter
LRPLEEEPQTWINHALCFALFTALFHSLQFAAALAIYRRTNSPSLLTYALDAIVSAPASLILALRIYRHNRIDLIGIEERWRFRAVAAGYILAGAAALYLGAQSLWSGHRPARNLLGIVLAAVSMLVIPIVGSYMKTLAVELRSQTLKSAAVFTFGNSYLSMVLLTSQLVNTGMDLRWGDPVGALVMFPFIIQKGIQILFYEGKHEYVED